MSEFGFLFLDDAPVGLEDNILWEEGHVVRRRITEFAEAIARGRGALTFAVYGAWGSGKTSFLQMVGSVPVRRA